MMRMKRRKKGGTSEEDLRVVSGQSHKARSMESQSSASFCEGPHLARDCRKKVNFRQCDAREKRKSQSKRREVWPRAMKLFDLKKTQAPPQKPPSTILPFKEVEVRNTKLYASVDTGALNMFLSSEAVKSLRL